MNKVISVNGRNFIDKNGDKFIPRGINMVCKDKSLGYIGDYQQSDFEWLKENGFNLVRLGLNWDGAEPEPGEYNESYFEKIDAIIERAAQAEIAVFLDMHQDLYSSVFEDGAPKWATITDGMEHIRTDLWSESYLMSPAVQHAFDNFWNNAMAPDGVGIRTHYVELWRFIAERYQDNPHVIGYDVMNEPFPGSAALEITRNIMETAQKAGVSDIAEISNPELLMELIASIEPITASFEKDILNPFYEELYHAIRTVDKNTIFMFESNYFANAGIPSYVMPVMDETGIPCPGQAYAPHGYDILVDTDDYSDGGTDRIDMIFMSLGEVIRNMPIPSVIGEWGCYPDASKAQCEQAKHLLGIFADLGIGNVYFDYSHIHDNGIIQVL